MITPHFPYPYPTVQENDISFFKTPIYVKVKNKNNGKMDVLASLYQNQLQ